ncbi:MAG: folylpolyglutamate synthase/dihydrofolate synthase family protein [Bacillota bacterium]|jgi:folylpolyglutamate synthase/dihydrofolate synthase
MTQRMMQSMTQLTTQRETQPTTPRLLQKLQRFGAKPGLERVRFLLDALGNPERAFPAVHVAGTNGKGSTSAMIAAMFHAAGRRVGLYTSPHLVRYNERIAVDGRPVADEQLARVLARLEPLVDAAARGPAGQPTEFEVGTAAAMACFAEAGIDVAVAEVGLGGRYDATNVVQSIASVITPLGLDHTQWLGDTLDRIAWEKAGIIRPGVPVVCAPQAEEALRVIASVAEEKGAPLLAAGRDYEVILRAADATGTEFDLRWGGRWLRRLRTPLLGAHQAVNGAVAAAAALALGLPEEAVRRGLETVAWPGRMEVVAERPRVVLDGAHNAEGVQALAAALQAVFPGQRPVFVIGILQEKPLESMLRTLLPLGKAAVFTAPRNSRTPPAPPEQLARLAEGLIGAVAVEPDSALALEQACALAGPDGLVCVCGSLYLVGEVRERLAGEISFVRE